MSPRRLAAAAAIALLAAHLRAAPGAAGPAGACGDLLPRIAAGRTAGGETLGARGAAALFYEGRGCEPAWSAGGSPLPRARALLAALRGAGDEGLDPADYHARAIGALLDAGRGDADFDLLLTDAFLLLAGHLAGGRVDPATVEPATNLAGRARDLVSLLQAAVAGDHVPQTLAALPPQGSAYRGLKAALVALRAAAAAGGWPIVPWGPALREGDRDPRVAALRARLLAGGDLPPGPPPAGEDRFDAGLAAALRRFQGRHGLDADAVAGRRTLSALNVPATLRASQVAANLERLRWLPRDLGPRHLLVNIPDFSLELVDGGRTVASMRVVAGREARRTPFLADRVVSVVLNPPWAIPERIAVEDKLPLILADRGWLRENRVRVQRATRGGWRDLRTRAVDWEGLGPGKFPYRLVMDPGPANPLGRVKFRMANPLDVYLHDTPARELFEPSVRDFSSGCIRVERAVELAALLLGPWWTVERLEAAIAEGRTAEIPLPEPMPAYLLYWTAWVDREGRLQLREDVYGSDAAVAAAMARPAAAPVRR